MPFNMKDRRHGVWRLPRTPSYRVIPGGTQPIRIYGHYPPSVYKAKPPEYSDSPSRFDGLQIQPLPTHSETPQGPPASQPSFELRYKFLTTTDFPPQFEFQHESLQTFLKNLQLANIDLHPSPSAPSISLSTSSPSISTTSPLTSTSQPSTPLSTPSLSPSAPSTSHSTSTPLLITPCPPTITSQLSTTLPTSSEPILASSASPSAPSTSHSTSTPSLITPCPPTITSQLSTTLPTSSAPILASSASPSAPSTSHSTSTPSLITPCPPTITSQLSTTLPTSSAPILASSASPSAPSTSHSTSTPSLITPCPPTITSQLSTTLPTSSAPILASSASPSTPSTSHSTSTPSLITTCPPTCRPSSPSTALTSSPISLSVSTPSISISFPPNFTSQTSITNSTSSSHSAIYPLNLLSRMLRVLIMQLPPSDDPSQSMPNPEQFKPIIWATSKGVARFAFLPRLASDAVDYQQKLSSLPEFRKKLSSDQVEQLDQLSECIYSILFNHCASNILLHPPHDHLAFEAKDPQQQEQKEINDVENDNARGKYEESVSALAKDFDFVYNDHYGENAWKRILEQFPDLEIEETADDDTFSVSLGSYDSDSDSSVDSSVNYEPRIYQYMEEEARKKANNEGEEEEYDLANPPPRNWTELQQRIIAIKVDMGLNPHEHRVRDFRATYFNIIDDTETEDSDTDDADDSPIDKLFKEYRHYSPSSILDELDNRVRSMEFAGDVPCEPVTYEDRQKFLEVLDQMDDEILSDSEWFASYDSDHLSFTDEEEEEEVDESEVANVQAQHPISSNELMRKYVEDHLDIGLSTVNNPQVIINHNRNLEDQNNMEDDNSSDVILLDDLDGSVEFNGSSHKHEKSLQGASVRVKREFIEGQQAILLTNHNLQSTLTDLGSINIHHKDSRNHDDHNETVCSVSSSISGHQHERLDVSQGDNIPIDVRIEEKLNSIASYYTEEQDNKDGSLEVIMLDDLGEPVGDYGTDDHLPAKLLQTECVDVKNEITKDQQETLFTYNNRLPTSSDPTIDDLDSSNTKSISSNDRIDDNLNISENSNPDGNNFVSIVRNQAHDDVLEMPKQQLNASPRAQVDNLEPCIEHRQVDYAHDGLLDDANLDNIEENLLGNVSKQRHEKEEDSRDVILFDGQCGSVDANDYDQTVSVMIKKESVMDRTLSSPPPANTTCPSEPSLVQSSSSSHGQPSLSNQQDLQLAYNLNPYQQRICFQKYLNNLELKSQSNQTDELRQWATLLKKTFRKLRLPARPFVKFRFDDNRELRFWLCKKDPAADLYLDCEPCGRENFREVNRLSNELYLKIYESIKEDRKSRQQNDNRKSQQVESNCPDSAHSSIGTVQLVSTMKLKLSASSKRPFRYSSSDSLEHASPNSLNRPCSSKRVTPSGPSLDQGSSSLIHFSRSNPQIPQNEDIFFDFNYQRNCLQKCLSDLDLESQSHRENLLMDWGIYIKGQLRKALLLKELLLPKQIYAKIRFAKNGVISSEFYKRTVFAFPRYDRLLREDFIELERLSNEIYSKVYEFDQYMKQQEENEERLSVESNKTGSAVLSIDPDQTGNSKGSSSAFSTKRITRSASSNPPSSQPSPRKASCPLLSARLPSTLKSNRSVKRQLPTKSDNSRSGLSQSSNCVDAIRKRLRSPSSSMISDANATSANVPRTLKKNQAKPKNDTSARVSRRGATISNGTQTHDRKTVDNDRKYAKCNLCSKWLWKKNLPRHIRAKHDKLKPNQCPHCDDFFSEKHHLVRHILTKHDKLKPNQCPHCDDFFSEKHNLVRHILTKHDKLKPHQCPFCGERFGLKQHLDRHIGTKHGKWKPHQCPNCAKCFGLKQHLDRHIKKLHDNLISHRCPSCVEQFDLKDHLDEHFQSTHSNLGVHGCSTCGLCFNNQSSLERHKRKHTNGSSMADIIRMYWYRSGWLDQKIPKILKIK